MFPNDLLAETEALLTAARARGWHITTAESCTGGLIAGLLTAIGGSSDVVDGGAVTYSNAAKTRMLGVPAEMIAHHGAVSESVARAMAEGARTSAGTELAIAVTGIAGLREEVLGLFHEAFERRTLIMGVKRGLVLPFLDDDQRIRTEFLGRITQIDERLILDAAGLGPDLFHDGIERREEGRAVTDLGGQDGN
jgi:nicotinamide-nucleotide amidase